MKILYVAPENVTGALSLYARGHRSRGNECRWVTFFRNRFGFEEDLCFDLHWMPTSGWVHLFRRGALAAKGLREVSDLPGNPPFWKPPTILGALFFRMRDALNASRIRRRIDEWQLNDYDVYHFEGGVDPFRNCNWASELARRGKGIACFYHGSDLRNRGVIPRMNEVSQLNLTSEIDLLERLPGMKYLFLPIDTDALKPVPRREDGIIRICHAARNRWFKGSDHIEAVVLSLKDRYPIDWVMIEDVPHQQAIKLKAECDIFIDQITDRGGWGYGASSVEALALGLTVLTRINPRAGAFLGDHPFIDITADTLEAKLVEIIEEPALREDTARKGRDWVVRHHGIDAVMEKLYDYYREAGWR